MTDRKEYNKQYYLKNREKLLKMNLDNYSENKDYYKGYRAKYYQEHKDIFILCNIKFRQENPDNVALYTNRSNIKKVERRNEGYEREYMAYNDVKII